MTESELSEPVIVVVVVVVRCQWSDRGLTVRRPITNTVCSNNLLVWEQQRADDGQANETWGKGEGKSDPDLVE